MTRIATALGLAALFLLVAAQASPAKAPWDTPPGQEKLKPSATVERSAVGSATGSRSVATATATCPGGMRATGGGFRAPSSIAVIGLVYESVKVHQRAWRATAQLLDLGAPSELTLTTYVYCRRHYPKTTERTETVPTSGVTQLGPTGTAICPEGTEALAGGFTMPPPLAGATVTELFFDSVRNGEDAWDARVATGPAGPSTMTSEVYCSHRAPAPREVAATSGPNGMDFTDSTATATCSGTSTPVAGGFTQPISNFASFFFIDESRRVNDGWQVTGLHSGMNPPVALSSYGYCS
jgi:hypothetical protein